MDINTDNIQYETDEEKVETLKKWLKENGLSIITGTLLGLSVIYGWRAWVGYRQSVATQASTAFEQILNASEATDHPEATMIVKQTDRLRQEFGSTAYADLAGLVVAKALYEEGKPAEAMNALTTVMTHAADPALVKIAALRLARIQLAEGDLTAASETINNYDHNPAFAGEFAIVRGDLATARGEVAQARTAYEQARVQSPELTQFIKLKLDNLPSTSTTTK